MTVQDAAAAINRFDDPIYTESEASRYLGLSPSTFRNWARGYRKRTGGRDVIGQPVITALAPRRRLDAAVPFVGLAEGYAMTAMRRAGVPMQRIRPALERLDKDLGVSHALASRRLFTDGAEVLFDYAKAMRADDGDAVRELVVVRDGQRVLTEVVAEYLRRVEFGTDGYALAVPLPAFGRAQVVADVRRSFGQPTFIRGGARLSDALSLFRAGEDLAIVAEEFGVPMRELEDVVRRMIPAG